LLQFNLSIVGDNEYERIESYLTVSEVISYYVILINLFTNFLFMYLTFYVMSLIKITLLFHYIYIFFLFFTSKSKQKFNIVPDLKNLEKILNKILLIFKEYR